MTEDRYIDRPAMLAIPAEELSDRARLCTAPAVSVLMMTRNHADYLRQAAESVIAQVCPFPFELIIGEDCSSDATREVAWALQREHPQVVRVVTAEGNVGITANFLRLLVRARGEFVAFLEGDDYWTRPDKLARQVALLDAHPDYAWCAARTANRMQWLPPQESYGLDEVLRRYIVHTSTVLFRTRLIGRYPRFPDRVCWESMLLAYLTEQGRCGFLNEEVSYYRRHSGGLWHNAERTHRLQMSRDCIDAMNDYFGGRYRVALADREAWIYRMDLDPPAGGPFGPHWRDSFGILVAATPRLAPVAPRALAGLWGWWATLIVTLPLARIRARLALGTRMRRLGRRATPPPLTVEQAALEAALGGRETLTFVQIGSNDGQQGDPLRPLLLTHPGWRGLFVEPVEFLFDKLRRLYPEEGGRFACAQVAVGNSDGRATLYRVARAAHTDAGFPIPHWCWQLATFHREVLMKNLGAELGHRLAAFIEAVEVETVTLETLFRDHAIGQLELLHLDTEGHDFQILRQLDFRRYRPQAILFEHAHLSAFDLAEAHALLVAQGYALQVFGRDTLALRPSAQ